MPVAKKSSAVGDPNQGIGPANTGEAVEFYKSARAEIVARLQLRDGALLAYTVAMGGFASFLVKLYAEDPDGLDLGTESVMFVVAGGISLFFTLIVLHHDLITHVSVDYLNREFPKSRPTHINQWLGEYYARERDRKKQHIIKLGFTDLRFFGQLVPLSIPALLCVIYASRHWGKLSRQAGDLYQGTIIVEVIILALIVYLHFNVRFSKRRLHDEARAEPVTDKDLGG